jgi:hypothetical protein
MSDEIPEAIRRDKNNVAPFMKPVLFVWDLAAPCPYCAGGRTGYASTNCENCMNTRLANPPSPEASPPASPQDWAPPWAAKS